MCKNYISKCHKCFICDTYFTLTNMFFPLKLIEILFLHYTFLFKTCSKSVTTCCHFPWTSVFVSEHHCDSYMILFIHNSNVRDIQVCDCICAEPSCEIDAEPCASLLCFLLFLHWGWCPSEFLWLWLHCQCAVVLQWFEKLTT